jgi:hypothetical protein
VAPSAVPTGSWRSERAISRFFGNHVSANNDNIDVLVSAGEALNASNVVVPQWGPTLGPWVITDNSSTNAVLGTVAFGNELGDGIEVNSVTSNVTVTANSVTGNQEYDIALLGAKGASVTLNNVQDNGCDAYADGPGTQNYFNATQSVASNENSFSANLFQANQVCVYVASGSFSNRFPLNSATKITTTDVVDGFTGSGSKGTSNSWFLTVCSTSTPMGLCPLPGFLPVLHLPTFFSSLGHGLWH